MTLEEIIEGTKKAVSTPKNYVDLANISVAVASNNLMGNPTPWINALITILTNAFLFRDTISRTWDKVNQFAENHPDQYQNSLYWHQTARIFPVIPLLVLMVQAIYAALKEQVNETSQEDETSAETAVSFSALIAFPVLTVLVAKLVDHWYSETIRVHELEQHQLQLTNQQLLNLKLIR